MEIQTDMRAIRHEDPLTHILQSLLLQLEQLLKERWNMHDDARSNEVLRGGVHEARRQEVEVVGYARRVDGMTCIIATLGASADRGSSAEDVSQFALALVLRVIFVSLWVLAWGDLLRSLSRDSERKVMDYLRPIGFLEPMSRS